MGTIECSAVIQYLKIKGWNPKVFHKDMAETHGENAPSHTIVKGSHQNFKEEETAFKITCVMKDLQAPWTKKWFPETVTLASCGWPLTDFQAQSHYSEHLTLKHSSRYDQRTGCEESISKMGPQTSDWCSKHVEFSICQYVPIWRRFSWLTQQIFA